MVEDNHFRMLFNIMHIKYETCHFFCFVCFIDQEVKNKAVVRVEEARPEEIRTVCYSIGEAAQDLVQVFLALDQGKN